MSARPILVVEDNATTGKMMRLALQAEGYSVVLVHDGDAALRAVQAALPALVLLDFKLPDMDGFEVARRLRELAPTVPVIAVTGWVQLDESRIEAAGVLDVLLKPIEPSRLVEVVAMHVGGPESQIRGEGLVLLVDDDPAQRKLAQLAFSTAGFEVIGFEDGPALLRSALERVPTVIVSDVLMPGMDGFALCKAARSEPRLATVPIVLVSAHYLEAEDRDLATRFGATRYVSRTAGFDAVVGAAVEAVDAPSVDSVPTPADDLQEAYLRRIAHQLERQATMGRGLARRVSLQATALSVLEGLSDTLSQQLQPEAALHEILARCLDAAGLSVGAILLYEAEDDLVLKAHVGSNVEGDWGAHRAVLAIAAQGALVVPSAAAGESGDALLTTLGAGSALVLPIIAREESLGVLLLASNGTDLSGLEGDAFVRAARSVSMQLGQALALSRVFTKLAAAEQRYRAIFQHARDAIALSTLDGVIVEANRALEELLGVEPGRLLGRSIHEFAPTAERDARIAAFRRAVSSGGGVSHGASVRRADGQTVYVDVSRTVIELDGELSVLTIARDVTARLRLEEQFRQAQKMEAVGRLAGGLAHDFNNVLSVILSYGALLLSDMPPDSPFREDVAEITAAGKRAADLTRQLLMFSRQQVIEPTVLDLNDLLSNMERMLKRILGEDVELVTVKSGTLGRVRVDPGSIEQVLMNLVVNARDAMPRGGTLTVETSNVTFSEAVPPPLGLRPSAYVQVTVRDTGSGIDAATRSRIFEPFFTTKEKGRGTGLGLSTVFSILQQCGGSVTVESMVSEGTSFSVFLPRVDEVLPDHPLTPARGMARGTETILLVEDDEQVRNVTCDILRRHGYVVIDARDPGEALLLCEKEIGIDALVTDVVMPHMSGPELAERLRRQRPDLKVLCVCGYTDDSMVRHGVVEQRFAFLQKPLTPESLLRKLRDVLDGVVAPPPLTQFP